MRATTRAYINSGGKLGSGKGIIRLKEGVMREPKHGWRCDVCGEWAENYKPEYCCNMPNRSCGCQGLPLNPCVCGNEDCANKVFGEVK